MILSEKYALNLPVSYVQAALLKDSIEHFANAPSLRRSAYRWYHRNGEAANILSRYFESPPGADYSDAYSSTETALAHLPENIRRLGWEFLDDVRRFSNHNSNWWAAAAKIPHGAPLKQHPPLTAIGRANLRGIINKYGLNGIAQVTGLSDMLRA